MVRYVVSIRDRALDAFGQPWFVPAIGAAIRAFSDEINRKDGPMAGHADDYDLFELGTFDEDNGRFVNLASPKQLAIGKQVFIPKEK